MKKNNQIHYVALGDSYTSGEGVTEEKTFPVLLVNHLTKVGLPTVIKNLAVSGFTTDDVLNVELPIYEKLNPTFATLLIGANDINHTDINEEIYREKLAEILFRIQAHLPQKDKVIVLTIPDFSISPYVRQLSDIPKILHKINNFNTIIKSLGKKSGVHIVDIFPLTQEMVKDPTLFTDDIHPSGKEYALWERMIYPVAYELLTH